MREIVLDTETTGLDPEQGDRIVEIAALELWNHVPTENRFHVYINPRRAMSPEALAVHGLDDAFLADKPFFEQVAQDFLAFVADARLVIHNAPFDMKFLNAELRWAGLPQLPPTRARDTLEMARRRFPGAQNSLDALCRRFGVDNSARTLHGALLDCQLLADVYLELVGGRQPDFALGPAGGHDPGGADGAGWTPPRRPRPLPARVTPQEAEAHAAFLEELGPDALWNRARRTR
ncbi:MAG: DNA polymerase III subunit epsilon [Rhodobacteraceae bacterium]|nr:DNA polymerase III subunit epsilon [Paracoccaceae bacterium]